MEGSGRTDCGTGTGMGWEGLWEILRCEGVQNFPINSKKGNACVTETGKRVLLLNNIGQVQFWD